MLPHYPIPSDEVLTRIRQDLSYSPTTGAIRWKIPCERVGIEIGDLAGYINSRGKKQGYVTISLRVSGEQYAIKLAGHRCAWYLMTSKWPLFSIDHRDRNRANNRWKNLRRSTRAVEWCNQTLRSDNKSGVRGVSILSDGRYEARIKCEYAGYYLGKYASLEEAAEARYRAERDFFGRLCATSDRRCRTPLALASEKGRSPAPQAA